MSKTDTGSKDVVSLNQDCVVEPKGSASCTIAYDCGEPLKELQWNYLKRDVTLNIEAGKSIVVKEEGGWARLNFFQAGTITGPMVFAEDELPNPRMIIDWKTGISGYIFGGAVGVLSLITILAIGVFEKAMTPSMAYLLVAGLILSILPIAHGLNVIFFERPEKSADRLKRVGEELGMNTVRLTSPQIDLDDCVKTIS